MMSNRSCDSALSVGRPNAKSLAERRRTGSCMEALRSCTCGCVVDRQLASSDAALYFRTFNISFDANFSTLTFSSGLSSICAHDACMRW